MKTVLVSLSLAMALAAVASAEPVADSRLMFDPGALRTDSPAQATPAPKPDAKRAAATKGEKPKGVATASQPLLLDSGQPSANHKIRIEKPKTVTVAEPGLGRVPFEAGSFGLETNTRMKYSEMPDGSTTRGWDKGVKNANTPSYFGLSLTVPTDSKMFAPLLPRQD